ncbi:MAG: thioredoxin domain-containing protein [Planctomycetia bacterium]|nr:thioredoxin domain-containing protein [Planctomycetia bacterium]
MPNRLAGETSPYLLQHAGNPVDWHPWGAEAMERARREDRPIFLSIGYSACHWCHVMEHESFEDQGIARQLNESFVSIKVDREERPDLDQVYMNAVQMMTGRGGWPMSVFLTTDLKPFYGGTYWPPQARMGMPGFDQVLSAVADAWKNRRAEVLEQAEHLTGRLVELGQLANSDKPLDGQPLAAAQTVLERIFDYQHGGFGGAPKFPHPLDLRVLLRLWRRSGRAETLDMVRLTLDKMAAGGIYDHLGGGFHRYSVDERWLAPHFEKMLYDNALLATCYLEAFQATGEPRYAQTVRETLDYLLREMTDSEGGIHGTQDADSEGEEGKFYVWTPSEVEALLGADRARTFCYVYDVSDVGNFEGKNILNQPKTLDQCAQILRREPGELAAELAEDRRKLLAARTSRVAPGLDDKVLVSWNGLAIAALAQAGGVLREPRYVAQAAKAARFILVRMRTPDGRLLHSYRAGQARFDAYLDDYACLADALVTLYEAEFDESWIDEAIALADAILARFADAHAGGFFYTAHDHEALIARPKDLQDSSLPSGTAMAVTVLLRLGKLCGRTDYLEAAERTLRALVDLMQEHPTSAGQMLLALDFYQGPTPELVLVGGDDRQAEQSVVDALRAKFWPNKVVALRPARGASRALAGTFAGKHVAGPGPTLFECANFACREPVNGPAEIAARWDGA